MTTYFLLGLVVLVLGLVAYVKLQQERKVDAQHPPPEISEISEMESKAAPADSVQLGINCFMRGDYKKSFNILYPAATQGNLRAQQLIAKMYYAGNGAPIDRDKYYYWLSQAAANGDKASKMKMKKNI
jgi:TPR repeat protein